MIKEFLETYFDEIIQSRKGNIEIIWNKVGKENFDQLNELFHVFKESFPLPKYNKLKDDLRNNNNSELVKKYSEIINKRDEILKSMKEYSPNESISMK